MWHILIWHWSETVFGAGVIGLRNAGFFVFGIFDENKKRMRSLDWRQDVNCNRKAENNCDFTYCTKM